MKTNTSLLTSILLLACALSSFGQPSITVQPTDQTANQSFSAAFKITATTTTPPLSYQWFFASNAIAGANTNILAITNAQPTNAGGYFVAVSDSGGSITSRTAMLTVVLPATLDPKIGPNIPIGQDPSELSGKNQSEIHLARSCTNPNLLIAAFQDGIGASFGPGAACSYAVESHEGPSFAINWPQLDKAWAHIPTDRHGRGCNFTFVDGHAEHYRWKAAKEKHSGVVQPGGDRDDYNWLMGGLPRKE